jgi:hypothetical protein
MFGDFQKTFGLNFPVDPQGGLFGTQVPDPSAPLGGPQAPSGAGTGQNPANAPAVTQNPAAGLPAPSAQPSPLGSALAPGQIDAGQQEPPSPAPAAGVNSPFGKANV